MRFSSNYGLRDVNTVIKHNFLQDMVTEAGNIAFFIVCLLNDLIFWRNWLRKDSMKLSVIEYPHKTS